MGIPARQQVPALDKAAVLGGSGWEDWAAAQRLRPGPAGLSGVAAVQEAAQI